MTSEEFVPADFDPPTALVIDRFRLEPLRPQHNEADHAAWTSSIEHIRSTPGFTEGKWPPPDGMSLEENPPTSAATPRTSASAPTSHSPSWNRWTTP